MTKLMRLFDSDRIPEGMRYLACSATSDWTDEQGNSVGTSATSGIYQMKPGDTLLSVISAAADAAAILYLPNMSEAAGKFYYIIAPTAATAGDISVHYPGTKAELYDLDADGDNCLLFCTGLKWVEIYMAGVSGIA